MTNKYKLTVVFDVTPAQALALEAMFKYWNYLSSIGSSREVAFFVDGDGNFHPNIKTDNPEILTDELSKLAIVKDDSGNRVYDYDPIAWKLDCD